MDNVMHNSNKTLEQSLKNAKLLFCLLLVIPLASCILVAKRACPAFYHSDASLWLPGEKGSIYRFADEFGKIFDYEIKRVHMNKKFSKPNFYGGRAKDLTCNLTRSVKMISEEKLEGFEFYFRHIEDPKIEPDKQYLSLTVVPIKVVGNELAKREQKFNYILSANDWYVDNGYYIAPTAKVINKKEYFDVLVSSSYDTKNQKPVPFLMNRIVLSKGQGVVQFRFVDNSEFNLVSDEP